MSNSVGKRKIFVSYKYKDSNVQSIPDATPDSDTDYMITPRHYVDLIIDLIGVDHIYKGEKSDDDASHLADSTINSKLKDKIFDSSITMVLLSPNMWDITKPQKEQWIPNEVYYSLLNKSRGERKSNTNAILLIALPDISGSYEHAVVSRNCGVRSWQTQSFFHVIRKNMFNLKSPNASSCSSCLNSHHTGGDHSYAHPVKWEDFIADHNRYIDHSLALRERIDDFNIVKHRGDT